MSVLNVVFQMEAAVSPGKAAAELERRFVQVSC